MRSATSSIVGALCFHLFEIIEVWYVSAQARSTPERQVRLARRGGDEILENIRHRHWRLGVREVSDTLEHLEATACPRVVGGVRVSDGNDPVAISPDQEGGRSAVRWSLFSALTA
jgi:hypothetical protein